VRISDAGMYTCVATVIPAENRAYVTGTTYTLSRNITIGGM
jgi:hypothetical protein